jgi:HSP20 family protein
MDTTREQSDSTSNGIPSAGFAKAMPAILHAHESDRAPEGDLEDEGQLTVDVYQTPTEIFVESPIAGVAPEDIDVSITPETVTIKGRREREREVREEDYVYQECYWGRFSRSVVLPTEVDADAAKASIKNGVLTIRVPKLNRARLKKVKVEG